MYARQYSGGSQFRIGSLGVALAINGGVVAALIFAGPELGRIVTHPPIVIVPIPLPSDPPPPDPKPQPKTRAPVARAPAPKPYLPDPLVRTDQAVTMAGADTPYIPGPPEVGPIAADPPSPPLPALVAARMDPRYADAFQPPYPDAERNAAIEGIVRLRVRIGTDGRVRSVERVGAGREAFFRAAERQALSRWRFRPATRGDVPEETWLTINVHFRMDS